jgi:AcrR family transcriptional regulator
VQPFALFGCIHQNGEVIDAEGSLFRIAEASTGLPDAPNEELWVYLDAAARCVERFGARRTTVRDISREAGVDRTTLYRNVGPLPQIYRLLLALETHRLLDDIAHRLPVGLDGPGMVVETVALGIDAALAHPVLVKLSTDEPEMIAEHILSGLDGVITVTTAALASGLEVLAETGDIAPIDPQATAEWIVRFAVTSLLAPPSGDLRVLIGAVLQPLLTPARPR